MIKAYTYFIGWKKLNLWYYGVRYKKGCTPDDFFTTYFSSSKLVHALMLKHGMPDVRKIRKTFNNVKASLIWEQTVLRRMNVLHKENWLNQNISGAINFTPAMRQIMSDRKKGRVWLVKNDKKILVLKELVEVMLNEGYTRWKPNLSGDKNGMWGKYHTTQTKNMMSKIKKEQGCRLTTSGRKNKSNFMKNNNPMSNPAIKSIHKQKMNKIKTASKKVYYQGKIYNSVREAAQHHPQIKYSTLAWCCANKKAGWSYDAPA